MSGKYQYYVQNVSDEGYAVSLPLACVLDFICYNHQPNSILDLGSGFSSFIFYSYKEQANPGARVCSVDTDPAWLVKTRDFLDLQELSSDGLCMYSDFLDGQHGEFDLIVVDLGGGPQSRVSSILRFGRYVGMRTVIILDDMNRARLRKAARRLASEEQMDIYSLLGYTLDSRGRYAWLLSR